MATTNGRDVIGGKRELDGERTKYLLEEADIPHQWYNIQPLSLHRRRTAGVRL